MIIDKSCKKMINQALEMYELAELRGFGSSPSLTIIDPFWARFEKLLFLVPMKWFRLLAIMKIGPQEYK